MGENWARYALTVLTLTVGTGAPHAEAKRHVLPPSGETRCNDRYSAESNIVLLRTADEDARERARSGDRGGYGLLQENLSLCSDEVIFDYYTANNSAALTAGVLVRIPSVGRYPETDHAGVVFSYMRTVTRGNVVAEKTRQLPLSAGASSDASAVNPVRN